MQTLSLRSRAFLASFLVVAGVVVAVPVTVAHAGTPAAHKPKAPKPAPPPPVLPAAADPLVAQAVKLAGTMLDEQRAAIVAAEKYDEERLAVGRADHDSVL